MSEQIPKKYENTLEAFRKEMRGLKDSEMRKKDEWEKRGRRGAAYDPHFDDIDPDLLTDQDRLIWHRIKDQTLTREELKQYGQTLAEELKTASPEEKKCREAFRAMILNKAVFITKRELSEIRSANKKE